MDNSSDSALFPAAAVAGFVLAGGQSKRMGRDKAFLELGGLTLLDRARQLLSSVAQEVLMVGDIEKLMTLGPVIPDLFPGQGPLAGIHAALRSSKTPLNLVLAVDLPFVEAEFLRYLLSEASRTSALATVPHPAGGWQPLCAVYRPEFAELAERALKRGKNKIDTLFTELETRAIGEEEMKRMGFSEGLFRNLNSPEDWKKAEAEMKGRGGGD